MTWSKNMGVVMDGFFPRKVTVIDIALYQRGRSGGGIAIPAAARQRQHETTPFRYPLRAFRAQRGTIVQA